MVEQIENNEFLTNKQAEIVKLKSQGLTNRAIAKIVYPEATIHAGDVLVSRQLKKSHVAKYVDQGREIALRKYNITYDLLLAELTIMLSAMKTDIHTGEVLPDYQVRLAAVKTFLPMLEKPPGTAKTNPITNPELFKALKDNNNEVELQRIVFTKNPTQPINT
jgi:hypothetical protein